MDFKVNLGKTLPMNLEWLTDTLLQRIPRPWNHPLSNAEMRQLIKQKLIDVGQEPQNAQVTVPLKEGETIQLINMGSVSSWMSPKEVDWEDQEEESVTIDTVLSYCRCCGGWGPSFKSTSGWFNHTLTNPFTWTVTFLNVFFQFNFDLSSCLVASIYSSTVLSSLFSCDLLHQGGTL